MKRQKLMNVNLTPGTNDKGGTNILTDDCATRFPLLLVHGVGVRDGKRGRIWGRIPRALQERGATVYLGGQDGWATSASNALRLREKLETVLSETGAHKVNLIAHSKGGLDARYLIALLAQDYSNDLLPVASLTTIATPHRGSRTLDVVTSSFRPVFTPLSFVMDHLFRALGDKQPNFKQACEQLTSSYMQVWNIQHPLPSSVYCQQFASSLQGLGDSIISIATYPIIMCIEGPNDGLVALESAAYHNFRGRLSTIAGRGISHAQLVDISRRPFLKPSFRGMFQSRQIVDFNSSDEKIAIPLVLDDILDFYIAMVADLKTQGF